MSSIKVTNLQHASAASPAIVLASDGTATAQLSSLNGGALSGTRNRIINGDMRLDQRNAGASVTVSGSTNSYIVDRFSVLTTGGGSITAQRSTTAPAGFTNSLQCTVATTDTSLAATDEYQCIQIIEGFNAADFDFGTANAKTVTVSFWVRSSITGTYGLSLKNSGAARSYPTSYSISAANTWEYKSITIPGDTTGTWLKDNGAGIEIDFCLGAGSSRLGTANAWVSANNNGATGSTAWISNAGATFYITGVQVESGSVSTPFERRSYSTELMLCQRYFYKNPKALAISGLTTSGGPVSYSYRVCFPVYMRVAPTLTGTGWVDQTNMPTPSFSDIGTDGYRFVGTTFTTSTAGAAGYYPDGNVTGTAEL